jgi:hypothetical protein
VSVWLTRRAILSTLALVVWVPGCAVATWWQVGIALGGESIGWVYSVMWPCFAVMGTVFWWFIVHDDPETLGSRGLRRQAATADEGDGASEPVPMPTSAAGSVGSPDLIAEAEEEDPELAAYNAYLASLQDKKKTWRGG